jgi:trehalose synthase-fused probable maltokinase
VVQGERVRELLPEQRWFGGKGRAITRVDVLDEVTLSDGPPALVVAIASATLSDGAVHLYHLPVLVEEDGTCRDAFDDVDRLRVLGELMTHGETMKGAKGRFHFGGPGLDPRSPPGETSIRAVGVEQSNSSVVLDETVILKLLRRVESGPNPDLELNRLLTNNGFENIPPHVGEVLYEGQLGDEEVEIDLGIAQLLIKDAREGWQDTLDHLRSLLDSADDAADVDAAVEERAAKSLDELARLGDVTASLHVLLAREELDPAVVSEDASEHDVKQWARRVHFWLDRLLDAGVAELEEHVEAIRDRIDRVRALTDAGRKTRVHGDLHLGQVLLSARGWMILDFEGEPLRPLEERRAKQSPLKDVAGMLRSFGYASAAPLFERAAPDSEPWRRLEPWARAWERLARDRFVAAYLRTSHEGDFLPTDRSALALLLDLFELEKALYELDYERSHRPHWMRIPLRGIRDVVHREDRR